MYCLIDFCCICFNNKEHLQRLSNSDSDNIIYFTKLISCIPEMCYNQMNNKRLVCNKCCETLDTVYKFRQRCLRSKATLTDYMSQLHQISKISGKANVYLTDINKIYDLTKEYEKLNISKAEIFKKLDEGENSEIKREINPKLIDIDHRVQFENVVVKMEEEDQFFSVNVEENFDNPLINRDEYKISQNDVILTDSAIKKENENQDVEERLQGRFENILVTCRNENDDMKIKVKENDDDSLYSDDPLANLDEINVDIKDNDIKLVKSELNVKYNNDDSEEFATEDNVIPLKDQDETTTDEDDNFFHKPSEGQQNKISSNINSKQPKNYDVNQKVKTVKKRKCKICKKMFQSGSLTAHMRKHNRKKPHECEICHKKFTYLCTLQYHKEIHTAEKQHECTVCNKKFICLPYLKKHMKNHSEEKQYKCEVCDKEFAHLVSWRDHYRIHTGDKPYACEVCEKKFTMLSNLREHIKIHTGEKRYGCDVCQKKFTHSSTLKKHTKIHTGKNLYECDICQRKFTQAAYLKKHIINHNADKPLECGVCQKKFKNLSYLRKHMQIHTSSHKCEVCQKKFGHLYNLKKHMRHAHAGHEVA